MTVWNWNWRKKGSDMPANMTTSGLAGENEGSDGVSRRDFLRVGSLGVVGLSQAALARGAMAFTQRRAILILMTGGPSQLDTFDPKPDAPASIRGPFQSIETAVPGLRFSETLPLLAQRSDRLTVIRSLTHDAAPIHETGQQLLQTGRLAYGGVTFPQWGSVVASHSPSRSSSPTNVIVNGPLVGTGVKTDHGQSAGMLGSNWEPDIAAIDPEDEAESIHRIYGPSSFGRALLKSRQLIERGTRCVTVNLFDSLHQRVTWDCHGDKNCGPATVFDYQNRLCPEFDRALSGLLDDLAQRGLLDDTLIIATGEFGRTPKINDQQGRDHWTSCWSGLIAGGRLPGGVVLGASDATASEPIDRPVLPEELAATLIAWCGVDATPLKTQVGKNELALIPATPLTELWG
jgi:Protein of unknown function (DUF1501)